MNSSLRPRRWSARNVTAVLGPTNTGKTHLAIERMLGHETGVIGLPLRLLAREVYGRVAARAGSDQVALVTGEEKRVPPQPRYWVSTVEAMPRETDAAFVAIDEVQLAGDLERGHVFTDRLLNLRGSQETLLLGAATMRGIIEQLMPGVHVVTRPRMSVLAYAGQKKLTRLPERSAIVAFSADEVYAVAELIRRQRGGAAVVLGALSPRTRNKQVEIYQSGDVDFLVATDAIGMGLNLDLDHVAFAANRKFDGYQYRELTAAELGQIAGRAGRHMRDGSFGVTGRVDPFPDPLVEALETHRFEPVRTLQWRNDELDFSSLAALKASLDQPATVEGLTKAPPADDQGALEALSRDEEIADKARRAEHVKRLWEVCRLPDYRKIAPAQHSQLVGEIFGFIADGGVVPDEWIAGQVRHANQTDGDIDTLSSRIAHIRTWTFVANQPDWLADPAAWRDETRAVEDALSDALHDRLTKRFVDRRTSVLMRRLRENAMPEAEITPTGDVLVEGHHVGMLSGFRFTPDTQAEGAEAQALRNAAQKALATAITDRAERLARAGDGEIVLSSDGYLRWQGEPIARLVASDDVLKPRFVILADEQLSGPPRDMVEGRLASWLTAHVSALLKPLLDLGQDQSLAGMARGIAFRLVEKLGILDRREVQEDVRGLEQDARASLRRHGVRFGAHHVYVPALLKPGPSTLLAQLWALKSRDTDVAGLAELPAISASGRTSIAVDPSFDAEVYRRFGFRVYGARAVRIDILERLADLIRPALAWRPGVTGERPAGAVADGRGFSVTPAMTSLLGSSGEDMAIILKGLGYRMERRPKPPEPAPPIEPPAGDAVIAGEPDGTPGPKEPPAEEPPVQEPTVEPPPPPPEEPPAPEPRPEEPPLEQPPSEEPPVEIPPVQEPTIPQMAEGGEPEMIEVWRPAPGRPRREERKPRPAGAERQGKHGRTNSQDGERRFGQPQAGDAEARPQRPERDRVKRPDRERPQRPERERPPRVERPQRQRERPIDPDSPFAALAALKLSLEKSNRE
jgi:ATP-dependent RNA helicase SUPV3L1/SUV3